MKTLLALKADFKAQTGKDWKQGASPSPAKSKDIGQIEKQLEQSHTKLQKLKDSKVDKVSCFTFRDQDITRPGRLELISLSRLEP